MNSGKKLSIAYSLYERMGVCLLVRKPSTNAPPVFSTVSIGGHKLTTRSLSFNRLKTGPVAGCFFRQSIALLYFFKMTTIR